MLFARTEDQLLPCLAYEECLLLRKCHLGFFDVSVNNAPGWMKLLLSTTSKKEVEHVVSAMKAARAKWTFEEGLCLFLTIGKKAGDTHNS